MWMSHGVIPLPSSSNKLEGSKKSKQKKKRAQDVEAIVRFCSVVSPGQGYIAFHPACLKEAVEQAQENLPINFSSRAEMIGGLVRTSYEQAKVMHETCGSTGPLPNMIGFRASVGHKHQRFVLTWLSGNKELKVVLVCYKGNSAPPVLQIIGVRGHVVALKAKIAELSAPTFDRNHRQYLPFRRISAPPQPQESEMERLMKVKVPLGDLLDFLRKYDVK